MSENCKEGWHTDLGVPQERKGWLRSGGGEGLETEELSNTPFQTTEGFVVTPKEHFQSQFTKIYPWPALLITYLGRER